MALKPAPKSLRLKECVRTCAVFWRAMMSIPTLETVDIKEEIKSRAADLPAEALEAFLSNKDAETVADLLEEL